MQKRKRGKKVKKEEFETLGISAELAEKAATASAKELEGYVSKDQFNEIKAAKEQAEKTVRDRDGQLEALKKSTGDTESLNKRISDLQEENRLEAEKHQKEMQMLKRESIDTQLLTEAGAKSIKAVIALMGDVDEKMDETAYKNERMKQLETVKKENDYLFTAGQNNVTVKGAKPMEGSDSLPDAQRSGYEARYEAAKKSNNLIEQIKIKEEAAGEGIILI